MAATNVQRYREQLETMRGRIRGEVDSVVESIREDLNPAGQSSYAPVHMADASPENLESDIEVVETERGMLDQVQAALQRIDEGRFGVCENCGEPIGEERLQAIPYAPLCIRCASRQNQTAERSAS